MATVQFRLSSRVSNGRAEVLVRFYNGDSFSQRAKTHVFCLVSSWSKQEELPAIPKRANADTVEVSDTRQKLEVIRECIYSRWQEEQYDVYEGWLQEVVDSSLTVKKKKTDRKTLREVFDEYRAARGIDASTGRQYEVLLDALERFEPKRVWYADKVTLQDIDDFCAFYRSEQRGSKVVQRSQNTLTGKLKRWRALQNFAVLRKYAPASPFSQFTIPSEVYGSPVFLTTEERDRLYAFEGLNSALRVQRDIFVFQCHVGCRVSDLVSLTKDNVTPDGFLQYIPQKQRRRVPLTVRVPLSQVAQEIIDRYADREDSSLLPFIHPNNYNEAIHQFLHLAGLDRVVITPDKLTMQPTSKPLWQVATSHTARKTFIEAMFRETKSERITSAFTGHAVGSRAFSRYTDVDDEMKRSILSRLDQPKK